MSEEYNSITCPSCGIEFQFLKKIESFWRDSQKPFFCPNGHGLSFPKEKESAEQKELKTLRTEVKELKTKLESALKDVEAHKKRADEIQVELEIWRPSTTEDQKAG